MADDWGNGAGDTWGKPPEGTFSCQALLIIISIIAFQYTALTT